MSDQLPRLVRMATQLKEHAPLIPSDIRRYLPQADLIDAAKTGLDGASILMDIPYEQMDRLAKAVDDYEDYEMPTAIAFKMAVTNLVMSNPSVEKLSLDRKVKLMGALDRFMHQGAMELITRQDLTLDNIPTEIREIEKWRTGFGPIDLVTGGVYQALMIIMAVPGGGKTSTMIALAEMLKRQYPDHRMVFFELEIYQEAMLSRMSPVFKRSWPFGKNDRLITGNVTIEDISEIVMEWPDDKQFVFVDSPDLMGSLKASTDDGSARRFELELIYRQLIRLKDRAKLIVAASQPRRGDRILTQQSVAESWAKAWYADIILGIMMAGGTEDGMTKLRMKVNKNRFGPSQNECIYPFDFANIKAGAVTMDEDVW